MLCTPWQVVHTGTSGLDFAPRHYRGHLTDKLNIPPCGSCHRLMGLTSVVHLGDVHNEIHGNPCKLVHQDFLLLPPGHACYLEFWCNYRGDIFGMQCNMNATTHEPSDILSVDEDKL